MTPCNCAGSVLGRAVVAEHLSAGRREFLAKHPLALRLWSLYHSTVSDQDTNQLESSTVYNCLVRTNLKPSY